LGLLKNILTARSLTRSNRQGCKGRFFLQLVNAEEKSCILSEERRFKNVSVFYPVRDGKFEFGELCDLSVAGGSICSLFCIAAFPQTRVPVSRGNCDVYLVGPCVPWSEGRLGTRHFTYMYLFRGVTTAWGERGRLG
jgi:hypothetical protein